jgi:hypothetical protein
VISWSHVITKAPPNHYVQTLSYICWVSKCFFSWFIVRPLHIPWTLTSQSGSNQPSTFFVSYQTPQFLATASISIQPRSPDAIHLLCHGAAAVAIKHALLSVGTRCLITSSNRWWPIYISPKSQRESYRSSTKAANVRRDHLSSPSFWALASSSHTRSHISGQLFPVPNILIRAVLNHISEVYEVGQWVSDGLLHHQESVYPLQ